MTTPRAHTSIPRLALGAATAATLLLGVAALPAHAAIQGDSIAGDIVTCTIAGRAVPLTGTSGQVIKQESTWLDGRGRAQSLFTIHTDHARLIGPDGTRYRLLGAGFDRALYPTGVNSGAVLREDIRYHFDVIGPNGRVGVVRFSLRAEAGAPPTIEDTSTCQLPEQ